VRPVPFIEDDCNYRKILVDANEDKIQKNSQLARRKEEATIEAKQEIKNLILREMTLKAEVVEKDEKVIKYFGQF
jgi:hypothetical protein